MLRMYASVTDDFKDHESRSQSKRWFLTAPDLFTEL
jgi:hypothetical protein